MDHAAIVTRMVELFRSESLIGLAQVRAALADAATRQLSQEEAHLIYRVWHTMRGSASMAGLDALAHALAELEDRWAGARQHPVDLDDELCTRTLELTAWLEALMPRQDWLDPELAEALAEWEQRLRALPATPDAAPVSPEILAPTAEAAPTQDLWAVSFEPGADLLRRGVDVLGLLDELSCLGTLAVRARLASLPPLEQMEPDRAYLSWNMLVCGGIDRTSLEDVFMFVAADSTVVLRCLAHDLPATWRWDEAAAQATLALHASEMPEDIRPHLERPAAKQATPASTHALAPEVDAVRVPRTRLDRQIDLVGELVIAQSALTRIAMRYQDDALSSAVDQVVRLAAEMRDSALQLRMVPARDLFMRIEHFVQSTHADRLQVRCTGSEVELDKAVLDTLWTPLKAIFTPQADATSLRYELSVSQEGQDLLWMLHSEAEDASRQILEQLQTVAGCLRAELQSLPTERGSTVCMRFPLSQNIIDGLLVHAWGQPFVVPLALVREVLDLETVHQVSKHEQDLLNLRGTLVPFIRLAEVFSSKQPGSSQPTTRQQSGKVLVVNADSHQSMGVLVDRVVGQQQVFIKPVPTLFSTEQGWQGTTILGDGSVALILDLNVILRQVNASNGSRDE